MQEEYEAAPYAREHLRKQQEQAQKRAEREVKRETWRAMQPNNAELPPEVAPLPVPVVSAKSP